MINKHSAPVITLAYNQDSGTFGKKRRSDPPAINAVIAKRNELRG